MYRYFILSLFLLTSAFTPTHAFNLAQKLAECQTHLKANRLTTTTGRGRTALPCYEAVLKKYPKNKEI